MVGEEESISFHRLMFKGGRMSVGRVVIPSHKEIGGDS